MWLRGAARSSRGFRLSEHDPQRQPLEPTMFPYRPACGVMLALTLAALSGCTDQPTTTQPHVNAGRPHFAAGDLLTVTNTSGGTEFGSLRWALSRAAGGEVIHFDASLAGSTIVLDTTVRILQYVMIDGPADKGITLSGGGAWRVLDVSSANGIVTLRNVTIRDGKAQDTQGAGGIYAGINSIVLEHTTVSHNHAGRAAAIEGNVVTLINSTVSNNISSTGTSVI